MPKPHITKLTPQDEIEVASRIRTARMARGLSQKEVADRMGISQTGISRLESAGKVLGLLEAVVLAQVLQVSVQDFLPIRLQE